MPAAASSSAWRFITDMTSNPQATLRLLLARHGQTEWNQEGRYQGQSDPPLSDEGRADAAALGERLQHDGISRIIASPLRRARETAVIVGRKLRVGVLYIDARLAEIAYGTWEGLTQADVKARWPDELRHWKRTPETMRFPGGETLAEARDRLLGALADLSARHNPGRGAVLAVTHGGLIRLALMEARNLEPQWFRQIPVEPGAITRLALRPTGQPFPSLSEIEEN